MLILVFFVLACNFYTLLSIYHCLFVILIYILQIVYCVELFSVPMYMHWLFENKDMAVK